MAAFGFEPGDYDGEVVWYWLDTQHAVEIFSRVRTQWRVGARGATGLDYTAVYPLMDRLRLSASDWDALLTDIAVLEDEALETMREQTE